MTGPRLQAIYRYPLKSARGESLQTAHSDDFGLCGDRRWMLTDPAGEFVSQRRLSRLAQLDARLAGENLVLAMAGELHCVDRPTDQAPRRQVRVWGDELEALYAAPEASAWLSSRLDAALHLVYLPDSAERCVDGQYASGDERVAFADGFPLLVLTTEALSLLEARHPGGGDARRFRPNLVISGAPAHAEDAWRRIRVGDSEIDLVKPCSRCVIPSLDPLTGERDPAFNAALARYRRQGAEVVFGMNGLIAPGSQLRVGDEVVILH